MAPWRSASSRRDITKARRYHTINASDRDQRVLGIADLIAVHYV